MSVAFAPSIFGRLSSCKMENGPHGGDTGRTSGSKRHSSCPPAFGSHTHSPDQCCSSFVSHLLSHFRNSWKWVHFCYHHLPHTSLNSPSGIPWETALSLFIVFIFHPFPGMWENSKRPGTRSILRQNALSFFPAASLAGDPKLWWNLLLMFPHMLIPELHGLSTFPLCLSGYSAGPGGVSNFLCRFLI